MSLTEQAEEGVRAAGFRFSLDLPRAGKSERPDLQALGLAHAGSPAL